MKILYFFALVYTTISLVKCQANRPALEYKNVLRGDGYQFRYKTDDSERNEEGVLDATKGESGVVAVSGYYSFVGLNGKKYRVDYVADENGYRPKVVFGTGTGPVVMERILVPYLGSATIASLTGGGIG